MGNSWNICMSFATNEKDRSSNEIFMKCNSCADISSPESNKIGVCVMDLDLILYKYFGNDTITVAMFDTKHNGIFGEYKKQNKSQSIINLSQSSITHMTNMARRENAAAFVAITYTKADEQKFPMFYLLCRNELAEKYFSNFFGAAPNLMNSWVTPYKMSLFNFYMSGKTPHPYGEYKTLSDYNERYKLPKIICGVEDCTCPTCLIWINHNIALKRENVKSQKKVA